MRLLPAPLRDEPIVERLGPQIWECPVEVQLREVITAFGGSNQGLQLDDPASILTCACSL